MGLFGFLKAPAKIFNRLTGATNSRKAMNAVRDDMERARQSLAHANAQSSAQRKRLEQMLDEVSGLDRQQKAIQKDYKGKLRRLEYDEQHLKGLEPYRVRNRGVLCGGSP